MRSARICTAVVTLLLGTYSILFAQWDPSLTLFDHNGVPAGSCDNSAMFATLPGQPLSIEIEGAPGSPFSVFMSSRKTLFPKDEVPPPLFLAPPLFPVLVSPNLLLDASGSYRALVKIPDELSLLSHDLDLYIQGFIQDRRKGFHVTNGITIRLGYTQYKVRLAMARGSGTTVYESPGEVWDGNVSDNKVSSGDPALLDNGSLLAADADLNPDALYSFSHAEDSTGGAHAAACHLYLNGIFYLVPGDAGAGPESVSYSGSSLYIHARGRICRNNENPRLPHIVVPVRDHQGEKISDLNLYRFQDLSNGESGFMALDLRNNDFYELTGTRASDTGTVSAWDPHVAISPDGKLMAAVLRGDSQADRLYLVKLQKTDCWKTGGHARPVAVGDGNPDTGGVSRIFAESMIFGGAPDPHMLFFATNRLHPVGHQPAPSPRSAASLFSVHGACENSKAEYYDFIGSHRNPKAGDGVSPFLIFGCAEEPASESTSTGSLVWLRSEDYTTIFLRAGWAWDPESLQTSAQEDQAWSWDIVALTDLHCTSAGASCTIRNLTRFEPDRNGKGYYIPPFGKAYNGTAKAAVSPADDEGRIFIAFTAGFQGGAEQLYVAPAGSGAQGAVKQVTGKDPFGGVFLKEDGTQGTGVFDPHFMRHDLLLFFYGKKPEEARITDGPQTDLFSYQLDSGTCRNLTHTAPDQAHPEKRAGASSPRFTRFGDVRPCGIFPSRDRRHLFFLRGFNGDLADSSKVNLIAVDVMDGCALSDLSGDEFSRGFTPDLGWGSERALCPDPSELNMTVVPSAGGDQLFFAAPFHSNLENPVDQVFRVSMKYPKMAVPVTSFSDTDSGGDISHLVPDRSGSYLAFIRSLPATAAGTGFDERIYVADVDRMHAVKEISSCPIETPWAAIYGAMGFVSNRTSIQFIYGAGENSAGTLPGNPDRARIWLCPLENMSQDGEVSYPLTEEGRFLLFNVLSVQE